MSSTPVRHVSVATFAARAIKFLFILCIAHIPSSQAQAREQKASSNFSKVAATSAYLTDKDQHIYVCSVSL